MEDKQMIVSAAGVSAPANYCERFECIYLRDDVVNRCQATNMKCEAGRCECYGKCEFCVHDEEENTVDGEPQ